jgi:hypothetical protein
MVFSGTGSSWPSRESHEVLWLQLYRTPVATFARFVERWSRPLFKLLLSLHCQYMLAKPEQYNVPRRTLHSLFAELDLHEVDAVTLLKVDTEGAEVEV